MFRNLGKLKYLDKNEKIKISLNDLKDGINFFDNFLIYRSNNSLKIYNRKCDHAGGKIISKDGSAICPIHMWKFNPSKGSYDNGVKKKRLNTSLIKTLLNLPILCLLPKYKRLKKNLIQK